MQTFYPAHCFIDGIINASTMAVEMFSNPAEFHPEQASIQPVPVNPEEPNRPGTATNLGTARQAG
jgi:hypothetical protein